MIGTVRNVSSTNTCFVSVNVGSNGLLTNMSALPHSVDTAPVKNSEVPSKLNLRQIVWSPKYANMGLFTDKLDSF